MAINLNLLVAVSRGANSTPPWVILKNFCYLKNTAFAVFLYFRLRVVSYMPITPMIYKFIPHKNDFLIRFPEYILGLGDKLLLRCPYPALDD